jgi:hypothetical protein
LQTLLRQTGDQVTSDKAGAAENTDILYVHDVFTFRVRTVTYNLPVGCATTSPT